MREEYEYRVIHRAEFVVQTPGNPPGVSEFSSGTVEVKASIVDQEGFSFQLFEQKLKELGEAGFRLIKLVDDEQGWFIIFSRTHNASFPRKEGAYRREKKR